MLDTVRYYQILLDAIARAPAEAVHLPRAPQWVFHGKAAQTVAERLSRWIPALSQKRLVVRHAAGTVRESDGVVLEFGVFTGKSIRQLARILPDVPIYGFDSFEGFPTDGRKDWGSDFSVRQLPRVAPSVTLVPGFFEETLPAFVTETLRGGKVPVRLVHVDCDLYSSTRTIFEALAPVLRPGLVVAFDELLHYHRFLENEALALVEMLDRHGLDFEWVALRGNVMPLSEFCARRRERRMFGPFGGWRAAGFYQDAAIRLAHRPSDYEERLARYRDEAERLAAALPVRQPLSDTATAKSGKPRPVRPSAARSG